MISRENERSTEFFHVVFFSFPFFHVHDLYFINISTYISILLLGRPTLGEYGRSYRPARPPDKAEPEATEKPKKTFGVWTVSSPLNKLATATIFQILLKTLQLIQNVKMIPKNERHAIHIMQLHMIQRARIYIRCTISLKTENGIHVYRHGSIVGLTTSYQFCTRTKRYLKTRKPQSPKRLPKPGNWGRRQVLWVDCCWPQCFHVFEQARFWVPLHPPTFFIFVQGSQVFGDRQSRRSVICQDQKGDPFDFEPFDDPKNSKKIDGFLTCFSAKTYGVGHESSGTWQHRSRLSVEVEFLVPGGRPGKPSGCWQSDPTWPAKKSKKIERKTPNWLVLILMVDVEVMPYYWKILKVFGCFWYFDPILFIHPIWHLVRHCQTLPAHTESL